MSASFTADAWTGLLGAFTARGYRIVRFGKAEPAERHLVLRHDVDICLRRAAELAEAEAAAGVSATYFVLLRSELYNPFSAAGLDAIRHIGSLGHALGLHFDAALYGNDPEELDRAASGECGVLEAMTGLPVEAVSLHRPARSLLGLDRPLAGRPHAYQPRYFSAMGYCSDSCGGWASGHPLEHPAVAEGRALQLLTHPIWWTGPAADPQGRLDAFLAGRFRALDDELGAHCATHQPGRLTERFP